MLNTLHPHGLLISDLSFDTPEFLGEDPRLAEPGTGFDEVVRSYLVRSTLATVRAVIEAHFPRGQRLGMDTFWVKTGNGREVAPQTYQLEITYHGRSGPLVYNRTTDATTQQGSQANSTLSAPIDYPFSYPPTFNARSNEGALSVRTSYVTTVAPDLTKVSETTSAGFNPLPVGYPPLPEPPANKWAGIADPVYTYPAGWVLEARPSQSIRDGAGNEVCWFVQDLHVYYQQVRPAG